MDLLSSIVETKDLESATYTTSPMQLKGRSRTFFASSLDWESVSIF